jgi:hypothetical protein
MKISVEASTGYGTYGLKLLQGPLLPRRISSYSE